MSRAIKFRAWKKSEKRMLNWFELSSDPADAIDALNAYKYEAVMQFTGLLDKEGVEIYEGDILGYTMGDDSKHRTAPVEYNVGITCFAAEFVFGEHTPEDLYIQDDFKDTYEVIGNRYQHPELLEQDK